MSIAELPSARGPEGSARGYDGDLTRTPPQDLAAEQSVLGAMLLSKDAIADVVEVLRGSDFYKPAHETIYDAILDLYGRGEPADAVTVVAELQNRGELTRVGGGPYVHTMISMVPTAANAGYYARIVRERAVLRRLVEAGTRIVQMGYAAQGGEADEIVDAAQAELYQVTEKRTSEDYAILGEIMEGTLDEIEAIGSRGGQMVGVPTGFVDFDQLTNGLHPGQMIVLAARPAVGKALALDTPLPTPTGWTTMGQVQVGEYVLGADGRPTRVVAVTDVMIDRPCYEVTFSDGTAIVADGEHGWLTDSRASRKSAQAAAGRYGGYRNSRASAEVRTTRQIAETLRCPTKDARLNHSVRNAQPLVLPAQDLLIPPYVLGVWLGAGDSAGASITTADPEITMHVESEGIAASLVPPRRHRRIPNFYLRGSERQRRDLLAGLLDTDGTVASSGIVQFCVADEGLATDVRELIVSLGYRCTLSRRRVPGRTPETSTAFTLSFRADEDVFRLERKRLLHKERGRRTFHQENIRFITDVRRVPSVPVRCIEVDSVDHLYLASRAMIPTHNSTLGLDVARSAAIKHGLTTVIFSLEMSRNEIVMRMLSAEARVPLHHMRSGTMSEDDWNRLARRMGEVSSAPLFIDDSPNMSMMEIRAKCRRLKQRHDLKLVVIDYLQLMTSGKRVESRQQEVSEFSRAIKLLAKELEVPVIAISQLNRGSEQRTDKKPQMSDLRESGCLTADTRIFRADTGAETTLGRLHAAGAIDVPIWALDDSLRYVRRHLTHVFSTGWKEVFRLRLASGKEISATANHPFLTCNGWQPLGELEVGSRVAVPRHVPAPGLVQSMPDSDVVLLAHSVAAVPECSVLSAVSALPKRQLSLFLRELWSAGASLSVDDDGRGGHIAYSSRSRRLLDDVSRLLLRFGISSSLRPAEQPADGTRYSLEISGCDDQRRFLREIGVHAPLDAAAERLLAIVTESSPTLDPGVASFEVWERVRSLLAEPGSTPPARFAPPPAAALAERDNVRPTLSGVATALADADLVISAVNDVLWDEIVSVEATGVEEVFDATVLGCHNFVANGIAVHNSIEQDADMVILLHREEIYDKESPRAGEADFIVAKHRNGPTATITVAFQGHYSRFVDMAQM